MKKCGSQEGNKDIYLKRADANIIEGGRRTNEKIKAKKSLIILLYELESTSIRMVAIIQGT